MSYLLVVNKLPLFVYSEIQSMLEFDGFTYFFMEN
jgi:hypothetical protein